MEGFASNSEAPNLRDLQHITSCRPSALAPEIPSESLVGRILPCKHLPPLTCLHETTQMMYGAA